MADTDSLRDYVPRPYPTLEGAELRFHVEEHRRIASAIASIREVLELIEARLPSPAVTFANLPASPTEGMIKGVTDSNTATFGATIAGGGANRVLAYFDGTNWTVS